MAAEIDLETYKPAATVPQQLLDLAEAHYSMHGNGLLFNLIAAVLPAHERMVREQVAHELTYSCADGDIPGSPIRHEGEEIWVHTTGQVEGWLRTLLGAED